MFCVYDEEKMSLGMFEGRNKQNLIPSCDIYTADLNKKKCSTGDNNYISSKII